MTFSDIFRSSFLNNVTVVTPFDMTVAVILAFCMGLFIFMVYRGSSSSILFSPGFGITLVAMTMISTVLILAVSSNITLSLGMVGALSIVRFRTAIKEPMDIAFLFWAIETGIVLATGMIPLAVIANVLVGLILLVLSRRRSSQSPFILILKCHKADTGKAIQSISAELRKKKGYCEVKGWSPHQEDEDMVELDMEVRINQNAVNSFLNFLSAQDFGKGAALVKYNGDYMG